MTQYEARPGAPKAILVDIDGTVALRGDRSPYDETRVLEDLPNVPVVAVVKAMRRAGYQVVFCSGRTDGCYEATSLWIKRHVLPEETILHMRGAGDVRKDSIVKREIFDEHVRDRYDVLLVLDDRASVVEMWRSLGLTVLQVAEGNF